MVEQLDLLAPPKSRRTDPITSRAAARKAAGVQESHHALIMAALDEGDGTIYDLGARTKLGHVECARRLPELKARNLAEPTGIIAPDGCRLWRKKGP